MVKYLNEILPLDILLFSEVDRLSEQIGIRRGTRQDEKPSSHIGIVVTRQLLPRVKKLKKNRLYVLESTITYPIFATSSIGYLGAQIRELEDILNSQVGEISWLRLLNRPPKISSQLEKYLFPRTKFFVCEKNSSLGYTLNIIWDPSGLLILQNKYLRRVVTATYFSPELIIKIFQKLKIISSNIDPTTATLTDLAGVVSSPILLVPTRPFESIPLYQESTEIFTDFSSEEEYLCT